jgi:hypothetical protein
VQFILILNINLASNILIINQDCCQICSTLFTYYLLKLNGHFIRVDKIRIFSEGEMNYVQDLIRLFLWVRIYAEELRKDAFIWASPLINMNLPLNSTDVYMVNFNAIHMISSDIPTRDQLCCYAPVCCVAPRLAYSWI